MRLIGLFILFFFSFSSAGNSYLNDYIKIAQSRCIPEATPFVSEKKTSWYMNLSQVNTLFFDVYKNNQRLPQKVYFDSNFNQFILPQTSRSTLLSIVLTDNFLKNVILHIEEALLKHYADFIFFPDMGHAHLLIPNDVYKKKIPEHWDPINQQKFYEQILAHKGTKFLYHTTEQMASLVTKTEGEGYVLPTDPYLRYRYLTRNIVGNNLLNRQLTVLSKQDLKNHYNTVKNLPGYKYWGAGYYIKSNENGCFPYKKKGKMFYFDLSLTRHY